MNHFYQNMDGNWDHARFRSEIIRHIDPHSVILDAGAGRGKNPEINFKGLAARVYGIDPDPGVLGNPYLDQAYIGSGENMPMFEDNQFDIIICCNVLEHLPDPVPFFREIHRVLKPQGMLLAKTPNRHHYVPIFARIIPDGLRNSLFRKYGWNQTDTFPTYYRANSTNAQKRIAAQTGFQVVQIQHFEGRPDYLSINCFLYFLGVIYERLVNLLHFNCLKVVMITRFRKL